MANNKKFSKSNEKEILTFETEEYSGEKNIDTNENLNIPESDENENSTCNNELLKMLPSILEYVKSLNEKILILSNTLTTINENEKTASRTDPDTEKILQEIRLKVKDNSHHNKQMEMLNELITINKNEKTVNRTNHADTERILQEILSNVKNNSHQNKLMGTLHDEIQKLKGDFYKEIQLPVIMDFIEVIDDIKRILKRFENISEEKQSNYIIKELNECANMADGLLRNRRIYAYPVSTNTGQPFNSERQKIETCGIIATHDEALDELVAESVKHGYEWQTDDSKSRIIRKEVVRIYEFQECEEENNYRRINKTKIN